MSNLPVVIGAAMPSSALADHWNWLTADARDLEIQDFAHTPLLDGAEFSTHIANLKAQMKAYPGRFGVHAPFWNLPLAAYDLKIRAVVQDRLNQALDGCAEIGATHMVIHSPLEFLGAPSSLTKPMIGFSDLFEVVHETLAPVVQKAESIGCTLVIENIFDKLPLMLTALVKSFNSDYVRQSLDTGHAYINYKQGAPGVDYFAQEAGEMLGHVHIQDTDGYTDHHWAIGDGEIRWRPLFEILAAMPQKPRLVLEVYPQDIQRSFHYLVSLGLAR